MARGKWRGLGRALQAGGQGLMGMAGMMQDLEEKRYRRDRVDIEDARYERQQERLDADAALRIESDERAAQAARTAASRAAVQDSEAAIESLKQGLGIENVLVSFRAATQELPRDERDALIQKIRVANTQINVKEIKDWTGSTLAEIRDADPGTIVTLEQLVGERDRQAWADAFEETAGGASPGQSSILAAYSRSRRTVMDALEDRGEDIGILTRGRIQEAGITDFVKTQIEKEFVAIGSRDGEPLYYSRNELDNYIASSGGAREDIIGHITEQGTAAFTTWKAEGVPATELTRMLTEKQLGIVLGTQQEHLGRKRPVSPLWSESEMALDKLGTDRDRGFITDDQYDAKRAEIVSEVSASRMFEDWYDTRNPQPDVELHESLRQYSQASQRGTGQEMQGYQGWQGPQFSIEKGQGPQFPIKGGEDMRTYGTGLPGPISEADKVQQDSFRRLEQTSEARDDTIETKYGWERLESPERTLERLDPTSRIGPAEVTSSGMAAPGAHMTTSIIYTVMNSVGQMMEGTLMELARTVGDMTYEQIVAAKNFLDGKTKGFLDKQFQMRDAGQTLYVGHGVAMREDFTRRVIGELDKYETELIRKGGSPMAMSEINKSTGVVIYDELSSLVREAATELEARGVPRGLAVSIAEGMGNKLVNMQLPEIKDVMARIDEIRTATMPYGPSGFRWIEEVGQIPGDVEVARRDEGAAGIEELRGEELLRGIHTDAVRRGAADFGQKTGGHAEGTPQGVGEIVSSWFSKKGYRHAPSAEYPDVKPWNVKVGIEKIPITSLEDVKRLEGYLVEGYTLELGGIEERHRRTQEPDWGFANVGRPRLNRRSYLSGEIIQGVMTGQADDPTVGRGVLYEYVDPRFRFTVTTIEFTDGQTTDYYLAAPGAIGWEQAGYADGFIPADAIEKLMKETNEYVYESSFVVPLEAMPEEQQLELRPSHEWAQTVSFLEAKSDRQFHRDMLESDGLGGRGTKEFDITIGLFGLENLSREEVLRFAPALEVKGAGTILQQASPSAQSGWAMSGPLVLRANPDVTPKQKARGLIMDNKGRIQEMLDPAITRSILDERARLAALAMSDQQKAEGGEGEEPVEVAREWAIPALAGWVAGEGTPPPRPERAGEGARLEARAEEHFPDSPISPFNLTGPPSQRENAIILRMLQTQDAGFTTAAAATTQRGMFNLKIAESSMPGATRQTMLGSVPMTELTSFYPDTGWKTIFNAKIEELTGIPSRIGRIAETFPTALPVGPGGADMFISMIEGNPKLYASQEQQVTYDRYLSGGIANAFVQMVGSSNGLVTEALVMSTLFSESAFVGGTAADNMKILEDIRGFQSAFFQEARLIHAASQRQSTNITTKPLGVSSAAWDAYEYIRTRTGSGSQVSTWNMLDPDNPLGIGQMKPSFVQQLLEPSNYQDFRDGTPRVGHGYDLGFTFEEWQADPFNDTWNGLLVGAGLDYHSQVVSAPTFEYAKEIAAGGDPAKSQELKLTYMLIAYNAGDVYAKKWIKDYPNFALNTGVGIYAKRGVRSGGGR